MKAIRSTLLPKVYNATVDSYPFTFLVMTALLYAIAMVGHAFLNSKQDLLNQQTKRENDDAVDDAVVETKKEAP